MPVVKVTLASGKLDVGMLLDDMEAIVPVDDYAIPHDNGVDYNAVSKNVIFKLLKFFCGKRRYLPLKFGVNSKLHKVLLCLLCSEANRQGSSLLKFP